MELDRFRSIDPIQSSVGWQIMADFVESLPAIECSEELVRALKGSHPFRWFKNSLLNYPNHKEQWFAFHQTAMLDLARDWIRGEGIHAQLKTNA